LNQDFASFRFLSIGSMPTVRAYSESSESRATDAGPPQIIDLLLVKPLVDSFEPLVVRQKLVNGLKSSKIGPRWSVCNFLSLTVNLHDLWHSLLHIC
jgi:hypothetical protein